MSAASFIAKTTKVSVQNINQTLHLLKDGATVPFISRYRKEVTGNLDEVVVGNIKKAWESYEQLEKRKGFILKNLLEQEVLTESLKKTIHATDSIVQLEDLYAPFKKKRQTKATVAREAGLEPLAKIIIAQRETNIKYRASKLIKGKITTEIEAIQGAQYIIAEWISEHKLVRSQLRKLYERTATISTKVVKGKEKEDKALIYESYFDRTESLGRCPSHRVLAMMRAENEGIVRLKIAVDTDIALEKIARYFITSTNHECTKLIEIAITDSYKRLLAPSMATEALQNAKLRADTTAISVFVENLKQLLLAAPLGEKKILALDPGFKSGCKLVCLDAQGNLEHNETIFPHAPQKKINEAIKKIKALVNAHKVEAIAIGNGTAARETEHFIRKIPFTTNIKVFMVNESGASVYSASPIARAEFPDYDVTVRGAVSIGRRLADPLAELVKIDPKSLGIGQYQHDVNQQFLKQELDATVERCVNAVGVNVNTASESLLSYVSGIGPKLAKSIVQFRTEHNGIISRKQLLKVKGLGAKAYEQSTAFLRIKNSKNPLDNSAIHPERYPIVEKIAKDLGTTIENLIGNKVLINNIRLNAYCSNTIGMPTLNDIKEELKKPGLDPRKAIKLFRFDETIKSISDLKIGMKLPGIVNNITNFGCFVDIGIKESGLIHVSKLANTFITNVNEVVHLNKQLEVTVIEVDVVRKRIQLSLIGDN